MVRELCCFFQLWFGKVCPPALLTDKKKNLLSWSLYITITIYPLFPFCHMLVLNVSFFYIKIYQHLPPLGVNMSLHYIHKFKLKRHKGNHDLHKSNECVIKFLNRLWLKDSTWKLSHKLAPFKSPFHHRERTFLSFLDKWLSHIWGPCTGHNLLPG